MSDSLSLVREVIVNYRGQAKQSPAIVNPLQAATLARKFIHDDSKEHFLSILLDGRNRPIGVSTVSVGTATASLVHPREVFQAAIGLGAVAIIVAHNHPSGDPQPSSEDREVTKRLVEAGALLGIRVADHIVLGDARHHSFLDAGEL
jgi:DNA repair protein RadC